MRKAEIRYLLSKALIKKEFTSLIINQSLSKTEKFIGFESLIRWNKKKKKGLISPNIFIPEVENTNFIIEIESGLLKKLVDKVQNGIILVVNWKYFFKYFTCTISKFWFGTCYKKSFTKSGLPS